MKETKAVLAVSFGTSFAETRQLTIDQIEKKIAHEISHPLYHAWTSKMILQKIRERDHLVIPNVAEAFLQMKQDGIRNVYVQPTHVLPGIENDRMEEDALRFRSDFETITFGNPLLTTTADHQNFIRLFMDNYRSIPSTDAILLMGHGTPHYVNTAYAALDYEFKDLGFPNVFVGTVEAYPDLHSVLNMLRNSSYHHIHLMPLMIVAGDHANHDMAGNSPDSWQSILQANGYEVTCHLHGLGELPFVQDMLVEHLKRVM